MFFAKTREDRDILVHEFNAICDKRNPDVELMSARQNVMHLIKPIDAFNAYNLSMSVYDNEHIIFADERSCEYIRDGVRCYASKTLRKELYITDGDLYKKPQKDSKLKDKYYRFYAAIDFKRHQLLFRRKEDKVMAFNEVLSVKAVELDYYEAERDKDLLFLKKFIMGTLERQYVLFAKTE